MNKQMNGASVQGDMPEQKGSDFVFAMWDGMPYGVVFSRHYMDVLEKFHYAQSNARTWGEFIDMLGSKAATFILPFTQDDDPKPVKDDLLDASPCQDVYVLSTNEFPITQCAEGTYTDHGWLFPQIQGAVEIRTEYGQKLELYPVRKFGTLKGYLDRRGYSMEQWQCPYPLEIYDYS